MDIQGVLSVPSGDNNKADDKRPNSQQEETKAAAPGAKSVQAGKDKVDISPEVARLKQVEEKVKAHEASHLAAGGTLAGSVSYQYKPGPDGKSYIVGGDVPIDISPGKTPRETIAKMEQVKRAALAPSDPSPQDRAVAAQAAAIQASAQRELQKESSAPPQTGAPSTADQTESTSANDPASEAPTAASGIEVGTKNAGAKAAGIYQAVSADNVFAATSSISILA